MDLLMVQLFPPAVLYNKDTIYVYSLTLQNEPI